MDLLIIIMGIHFGDMLEGISSHIGLWSIKPEIVHPIAYSVKNGFLFPPIFIFVLVHQVIGLSSQVADKSKDIILPELQALYVIPHQLSSLPYVPHLLFHEWGSFLGVLNHLILFCLHHPSIIRANKLIIIGGYPANNMSNSTPEGSFPLVQTEWCYYS
ncbi:hypothetical protein Hanom_Chr02g00153751 [Helianthus anomalus]